MAPRTPTGPHFRPRDLPGGDAATFIEARFKGSEIEDRWPCTGTIDIDAPIAEVASWFRDAHVDAFTAGSCRVTLGSWSWTGLLAHVLRLDVPFRIVGPAELSEAADSHVERLKQARP
ncbi:WYL domain-containing protein [Brevibacterium atlanticum]|uniref:WYL domain-containing protein n=1 Tax=Brevibacterium atlanticum TaxID=2697563 RepID=UPI00141F6747|nr:WYL domain-containing protein [Brevibacterium atlanticum]